MKFKLHGALFSLLFVLGLVFSFSIWGCGDGGDGQSIKAEDVDPGNQEQMEKFLKLIVDYHDRVEADNMGANVATRSRAITIYGRDLRRSEIYHHGEVYGIIMNVHTGLVVNHPKYPELLGYKFNPDAGNSDVAGALKALLDGSVLGATNCERYGQNDDRVACATRIQSLIGGDGTVVVAGIHHAEDDAPFELPDCPGFGFELETSAEDVYNDQTNANLQAYVRGIIKVTQKGMQEVTDSVVNEDPAAIAAIFTAPDPQAAAQGFQEKLSTRFSERIACYGSGDFKHENIYVFIMSTDLAGTVLLNGNNFDLNGLNLEADDNELPSEDKSIAGLFRNALTGGSGEPQAGQSATVCYRWDDPLDPNDTIEGWFENGWVPGSSPKTSYIEVADLFEGYSISIPGGPTIPFPPQLLTFGSGTYPEDGAGNCPDGG